MAKKEFNCLALSSIIDFSVNGGYFFVNYFSSCYNYNAKSDIKELEEM